MRPAWSPYLSAMLDPVKRVELLSSAWQADVLPLNHTELLAPGAGLEPVIVRFWRPLFYQLNYPDVFGAYMA